MKKQTIEQRLQKLEENQSLMMSNFSSLQEDIDTLKGFEKPEITDNDPNGDEWITIDFSVAPKETFDFYGVKPFKIMKRKMRKDGNVWNHISWIDSKAEAEKLGLRLPHIKEILFLLDLYKKQYPDNVNIHHNDFLGIEELNYDESVPFDWVDGASPSLRGDIWGAGSAAGVFTLHLDWDTGVTSYSVGFRCAR